MLSLRFSPFPVLYTERLVLQALSHEDDAALMDMRSDAQVNKFLDRPKQIDIDVAKAYIEKIIHETAKNECIAWSIRFKDTTNMLGSVCFWNFIPEADQIEIGYEMHPAYYGKGIMQEAVQAVIQYAFDTMQVKTIVATPMKANQKSIQLLIRNQFIKDEHLEKYKLEDLPEEYVLYVLRYAQHNRLRSA